MGPTNDSFCDKSFLYLYIIGNQNRIISGGNKGIIGAKTNLADSEVAVTLCPRPADTLREGNGIRPDGGSTPLRKSHGARARPATWHGPANLNLSPAQCACCDGPDFASLCTPRLQVFPLSAVRDAMGAALMCQRIELAPPSTRTLRLSSLRSWACHSSPGTRAITVPTLVASRQLTAHHGYPRPHITPHAHTAGRLGRTALAGAPIDEKGLRIALAELSKAAACRAFYLPNQTVRGCLGFLTASGVASAAPLPHNRFLRKNPVYGTKPICTVAT
jgi:hypothetical protein